MTKTAFIAALTAALRDTYQWAHDPAKLDRFMQAVRSTLRMHEGSTHGWCFSGSCTTVAWRAIGGKGKPTLKALIALPE